MSRDEFDIYMAEVITNKIQHVLIPTLEPSGIGKSQVQSLVNCFYQNYWCTYTDESTFTEFLNRLDLDSSDWTRATYEYIFDFVFKEFMNVDKEVNGLSDPYLSMIEILRTLTSYTLTIVPGPVSDNINLVNIPTISFEQSDKSVTRMPALIPLELEFNPYGIIKQVMQKPVLLNVLPDIVHADELTGVLIKNPLPWNVLLLNVGEI
jgi:hypothetical protein